MSRNGSGRTASKTLLPPNGGWINVGDFWNDPRRWDSIDDPHKTCFWMMRRPDVIDVRRSEITSVPRRMGTPYSDIMGNATGSLIPHTSTSQQAGLANFLNVGGPIW